MWAVYYGNGGRKLTGWQPQAPPYSIQVVDLQTQVLPDKPGSLVLSMLERRRSEHCTKSETGETFQRVRLWDWQEWRSITQRWVPLWVHKLWPTTTTTTTTLVSQLQGLMAFGGCARQGQRQATWLGPWCQRCRGSDDDARSVIFRRAESRVGMKDFRVSHMTVPYKKKKIKIKRHHTEPKPSCFSRFVLISFVLPPFFLLLSKPPAPSNSSLFCSFLLKVLSSLHLLLLLISLILLSSSFIFFFYLLSHFQSFF